MRHLPLALLLATVAAPAAATADVGDPLAGLQAMRELNLIVLGDMRGSGTVEGKAFVGGNLANETQLTVGIGNKEQSAGPSKRATLSVAGDISGSVVKLHNGPNGADGNVGNPPTLRVGGNQGGFGLDLNTSDAVVEVGGTIRNINGTSGSVIRAGGKAKGYLNANGAKVETELGRMFAEPLADGLLAEQAALNADLTALSRQLATLDTTKGNNASSFGNRLTFEAVDNGAGVSVFNMTADIFKFSEFDMKLMDEALTVIINVSGSDSYTWNANAVLGFNSSLNDNIIWNFAGAKKLEVNRATFGAVLATGASLRNNAAVEGSIAVAELDQNARIGNGTYAGPEEFEAPEDNGGGPVGAVPEPATWAMLIAGFGLVGVAVRRRRGVPVRA